MYKLIPVGVALLLCYAISKFLNPKRDAKVPHLRVSTKRGAAGKQDDLHTHMTDIAKLYDIGYERYSRHGVHYALDAPKGKELVVAPQVLDEIHRASNDYLDNITPNQEATQFQYTCGPKIMQDHFHIDKPITKLTQSLGNRLGDLVDQGQATMKDHIGDCPEWTTKKIFPLAFPLVTTTANRLLFGKELARDPGFLKLSIDYTAIIFSGAWMIRNYPEFLKPFILAWKTGVNDAKARARRFMVPIFEEG